MNDAHIIRGACVTAWNLTYDNFVIVMGFEKDYYSADKYQLMRQDFARWFCNLDSVHARKFAQYSRMKREESE